MTTRHQIRRGITIATILLILIWLAIYVTVVWVVGGWLIDTYAPAGPLTTRLGWWLGYSAVVMLAAHAFTESWRLVANWPIRIVYWWYTDRPEN